MPQAGQASLRSAATLRRAEPVVAPLPVAQGRFKTAPRDDLDRRAPRLGSALQISASLLWVPQAALLSMAVGEMAVGAAAGTVVPHAAGVLALGVARSILDAAGARITFRGARASLSAYRQEAVAALASWSPIDKGRPASGVAASTLAEQAEAVVPYLSRYQPARLRAAIVPAALLLCVLAFSWVAALVLLVAAPLIPIFMALVGWRAKAASEAQLVELASMNGFLLDRLRGLATIRALDAVDRTATRLRADAENLRVRTMAVLRIAFLSSAVLELFAALGVAMVAVYVGFHLLGQLPFGTWGDGLSLAEGLFILLLAPAFFEPLRDLSAVWHDRAAGEAALEALGRLGGSRGPIPECAGRDGERGPVKAAPASVRIEQLGFRHRQGGGPVFDGFDLAVAPGEHVALLAPSGAGKSTLLALIAGLAFPGHGRILIDGEAMSERTSERLHRSIAWMGQHPHIFPGTLEANVALGRRDMPAASVHEALRLAGLEQMAASRGTAPIGENGVGLSGGEASRLALARVMAMPEAGLVLADEPTAHLDAQTANAIADALIAHAGGRTLIVATHDPALAARMDRIVRLAPLQEEGR